MAASAQIGAITRARLSFAKPRNGHTQLRMILTALTVLAGAALGGGVAVDVTAIVIVAAVALVALAAVNGARMLGEMSASMDD